MHSTKLLLFTALLLQGCASSYEVYRVDNQKAGNVEGVHYSLPRSVVVVEVPVKKTVFKPGRFAKFSNQLLGVQAKTQQSVKFGLTGNPGFSTRSEPDPDQVFLVRLDGGKLENRELLVDLTERGLLTHSRSETTSTALDFTLSTLETVASIAARSISPVGGSGSEALGGAAETARSTALSEEDRENLEEGARVLLDKLNGYRRIQVPEASLETSLDLLVQAFGTKKIEDLREAIDKATKLECGCTKKSAQCRLVKTTDLRKIHSLAALRRAKLVKPEITKELNGFTRVVLELPAPKTAGTSRDEKNGEKEGSETGAWNLTTGNLQLELTGDRMRLFLQPESQSRRPNGGGFDNDGGFDNEGDDSEENTDRELLLIDAVDLPVKGETIRLDPSGSMVIPPARTAEIFRRLEEILARAAARQYFELVAKRNELITGSTSGGLGGHGVGFEKALEAIDADLKKSLRLFIGQSSELVWSSRIEWTPPQNAKNRTEPCQLPLFELAEKSGVLLGKGFAEGSNPKDPKNCGGSLVLTNPSTTKLTTFVVEELSNEVDRTRLVLEVEQDLDQLARKIGAGHGKASSEDAEGLYYRIPGIVAAKLSQVDSTPQNGATRAAEPKEEDLIFAELAIPQFGEVRFLPKRSGSWKKSKIELKLFENSGAIDEVTVIGEAISGDALDPLAGTFDTIRDARDAAEPKTKSQAELLTEQKTLLSLERDILKLEDEIRELENPIPSSGAGDTDE